MLWDIHIYSGETQDPEKRTRTEVLDVPDTCRCDLQAVYCTAEKKFKTSQTYMLAVPHKE